MSETPASLEQVSFPVGVITYREDGTMVFESNSNVSHPPASITVEMTYEGRKYKGVLHLVEDNSPARVSVDKACVCPLYLPL